MSMTSGRRAAAIGGVAAAVALAALPGAAQAGVTLTPHLYATGNSQGAQYDYAAVLTSSEAGGLVASIGGEGVAETHLNGATPADDATVFSRANELLAVDPASPSPSGQNTTMGLQVDGVNAWIGGLWANSSAGGLNVPYVNYDVPTVSTTTTPLGDGGARIDEHDTVQTCQVGDPTYYPLAGFDCPGTVGSGVSFDVTTTMSSAGDVLRREWAISSTDGSPHTVRLVLHDGAYGVVAPRVWRLPGDTGYATRTTGELVTAPAAGPFTLEARSSTNDAPDGADLESGLGAITYSVAPTSMRFVNAHELIDTYDLSVPAVGAASLTFVLSTEPSQTALDAAVTAAEASLGGGGGGGGGGGETPGGGDRPGDTPGDGNPGSGSDPGTTPGPGSAPATNRQIDHSTGTGTPRAAAYALPSIARSGSAKLARGRLSLGYAASCPGRGPACSVAIAVTSKPKARKGHKATMKTLAKTTVSIPAGKRLVLSAKAKLSQATLRRAAPRPG
ncbi:MAG TPA: hypothetical protein VGM91_00325 [Conexibacter sp.]|jgi:hypothetical protein